MTKKRFTKIGLLVTLFLFITASIMGFFKVLGADYGEVQPIWTRLSEELTYLKDNNGRLHFFPIRMGAEGWAYCINPGILGPEAGGYDAKVETLEKAFSDNNTRKVLRTMVMEGFRLAEEKGCGTDFQKWYAVQMAISTYIKDGCRTTGSYRNSIAVHSDTAVYNGFHRILDYVSNTNNLIDFTKPAITASLVQMPADDTDMASFKVDYKNANKKITFEVALEGDVPKGAVLDKNKVLGDGALTIKIPKSSLVKKGSFKVAFKTKSRVWDVVFLETTTGKQHTVTATNPMVEAYGSTNVSYEPAVSKIKLFKKDEDTGRVLEGAVFEFWTTHPDKNGGKESALGQFTTDENGEITIDNLLPETTPRLYFKEIKAPTGYEAIGIADIKEIAIDGYNKTYGYDCFNKKEIPKIKKTDLTHSQSLSGTEFEIRKEDGGEATVFTDGGKSKSVPPLLTSDEAGRIHLPSGLDFGKYQLIETKAPAGYLLKAEPFYFNWTPESSSKEVVLIGNRQIELETFIQKTGDKIVESKGTIQYALDCIKNASNVPLDNFTWEDQLPSEYVDIKRIETGVYQEPEGYELFLTTDQGVTTKMKNPLIDKDDQLTRTDAFNYDPSFLDKNIGFLTRDILECLTGNEDYSFDNSFSDPVTIITYDFLENSRITNIETGVFNNGHFYDLYMKTNKRAHVLVEGELDPSKSHKFQASELLSEADEVLLGYSVCFKEPSALSYFTTGKLINSEVREPKPYSIYVATDKRPLFQLKSGLSSDKNETLTFSDLGIDDDETIEVIKTIFESSVLPGFRNIEGPILKGQVKDLQVPADKYFMGEMGKVLFPNQIFVSGEYEGLVVENGDEWDTYTTVATPVVTKEVKGGVLPSTGHKAWVLLGAILSTGGFILVLRYLKKHHF